jgi:WD40 repeat protein
MIKSPPHIPDYELLRPIGQGAFGEVWLARAVTGQYRAVKVVRRDALPNQHAFEREFAGVVRYEPISRTQPNLVQVLHVGRAPDAQSFWYVMELADDAQADARTTPESRGSGQPQAARQSGPSPCRSETPPLDDLTSSYVPRTLRSVLRGRGRMPVSECLPIALGLTAATAHLHAQGLVHRDIKPSNVIFVQGVPKLADIGLVTAPEEQPSFVGTAGYIPPDGPGTPAADIYALGRVFYEMATGREVRDFPRLPEDFNTAPDRSALIEFNEIVLRAADNDPRRRHPSVEALRSDLLLLAAGHSVRRLRGLERRLRLVARTGAVGAGVALVSIALGLWANSERLRAVTAERELSARFVEQQLALARATRLTGLPGQRHKTLEIVREASRRTNSLALRNEAIAAMALPDVRPFRTLASAGTLVAFDRLMQRYATNSAAGDLQVRWLEDGHPLACLSAEYPAESAPAVGLLRFEFSADGEYLGACYTNHQLLIWRLRARPLDLPREQASRLPPPGLTPLPPRVVHLPFEPCNLTMVPGSPLVAVESTVGSLHFFDLQDGRQARVFNVSPHLGEIAFSADGTRLARIQENVLIVQDAANGEVRQVFTNTVPFGGIAWHPDGRQIVTWAWPGQSALRLWNLETGRLSGTLQGHEAEVTGAAFDDDGQWLVTASWDDQTVLWSVPQHREVIRLPGSGNLIHISADARRIGWRSWNHREWEVLELTPTTEVVRLEQHPGLETPEGLRSLWGLAFLDAEILAGAGDEGFSFWQPPLGYASVLARVGLERPIFASPGLGFYSSGTQGVRHWPLAADPARNNFHIGPPERFAPSQPSTFGYFALSTNGLRTALVTTNRQLFVHTERDGVRWRELASGDVHGLTIEPGGGYVVASFRTGGIRIWDAKNGEVITNLPSAMGLGCDVSPDGHWLAVETAEAFRLWRVADWRLVHEIHRAAVSAPRQAWSPDGQMLLVHDRDSTVRLLRTGTWEELGSLPAPRLLHQPCFSPDGTRLALPGEKSGVDLWDLRRLRGSLAELGLDWNGPPYLPPHRTPRQQQWRIRVDPGS